MLGIYVHIPFCIKKCNYCNFFSITDLSLEEQYVKSLIKEIQQKVLDFNLKNHPISTIYIGGGTPSTLKINSIVAILNVISKYFDTSSTSEITIECNPGTLSLNYLKDLKTLGFNRISLGTQSFLDNELKMLGRIHNSKQNFEAINLIRKSGFDNLSLDLIYSLPGQSSKDLKYSLEKIINIYPEHISTYCLSYPPKTKIFTDLKNKKISKNSNEKEAQLYKFISRYLRNNNYYHYEISNFCRKKFHSLHNVNYWKRKEYLGFGPSAHSFVGNTRFKNTSSLQKYLEQKNVISKIESLKKINEIYEFIFLSLRYQGINYKKFHRLFSHNFDTMFSELINKLIQNKYGFVKKNRFKLTLKGYSVCNSIAVEFLKNTDHYLQTMEGN